MKRNLSDLLAAYAAPTATILGGLILLFSPDTATVLIATVLGWAALILGIILAMVSIAGKQGMGAYLRAAVSILIGVWLTRSPMSLAVAFGKILGIGLLLGAISGFRKSASKAGRTIYLAEGAFGLVLLVAPLTATRTVYTIVGLVLVAAGIVMLVNKVKNQDRLGPGNDNIIDV